MLQARYGHTATLLPTGKVLIAGGFYGASLSSAELYDPDRMTFTSAGAMTEARSFHTATSLPSGEVLVTGGHRTGTDGDSISLQTAEVYDPKSNSFTPVGDMIVSRTRHTATLLQSGRVLLAGGEPALPRLGPVSEAELYDPESRAFSPTPRMNAPRVDHSATLLSSGKVLIVGGRGGDMDHHASGELFDPEIPAFIPVGDMTRARAKHAAVSIPGDRALIAGGIDGSPTPMASIELFDLTSGAFTSTFELPDATFALSAVVMSSGDVLFAGGNDSYDTTTLLWRSLSGAAIYNPEHEVLTPAASMNSPRANHTATLLPNHTVLLAGGTVTDGVVSSAELYF